MSKSKVKVAIDRGKIKLRWTLQGQRISLSPGLNADDEVHMQTAEGIARQIELDILSGNYDPSKEKYRPGSSIELPKIDKTPLIPELWRQYVEFKSKQVQQTTVKKYYGPMSRTFERMPDQHLGDAIKVRNWLAKEKSTNTLKHCLTQLSACCKWAVKSQIIESNPFEGMAADVKMSKSLGADDLDIKPFTAEERDRIIEAFSKHPRYVHYAQFVKFLFFTGCRPSEAIALQWNRVYDDRIVFDRAAVSGMGSDFVKEGLKTQSSRKFPINEQLRGILEKSKSMSFNSESLVLPNLKGGMLKSGYFRNQVWPRILASLGIEYRKPYQTRHTFITLCLDAGIDAKDVAAWVGNSPEVIYKHYAGATKNLQVPTL